MMNQPMTTAQYSAQIFTYQLAILFAQQRYHLEIQALHQLKITYDGHVPPTLWERQRRRTLHAHARLMIRRTMLRLLLEVLNN